MTKKTMCQRIGISFVLILLSIGSFAQDLIVAAGTTRSISSNTTESFDNAVVDGKLIVEANATLIILGDFTISSMPSTETVRVNIGGLLDIGKNLTMHNGTELYVQGEVNTASLSADAATVTLRPDATMRVDKNDLGLISSTLVISPRAEMIVSGNVNISQNSSVDLGQGSTLEVLKNFAIDTVSQMNLGSESWLRLTGNGAQTFTMDSLSLENLVLQGNGDKVFLGTQPLIIAGQLNINDSRLIYSQAIILDKASPSALQRTSGYIICPVLKKMVSETGGTHLFPVGGDAGARPVQLTAAGPTNGYYCVEYHQGAANNLTSRSPSLVDINNKFYHKIYGEGTVSDPHVTIYYKEGEEGPFNKVVSWSNANSLWLPFNNFSNLSSMAPNLTGVLGKSASLSAYNEDNPGSTLFVLGTSELSDVVSGSYAVLRKELDGGFFVASQSKVKFMFEEEYAVPQNSWLTYTLYNDYHLTIENSSSQVLIDKIGFNKFELDVSDLDTTFGILEVQNEKGEKWFLRIKKNPL